MSRNPGPPGQDDNRNKYSAPGSSKEGQFGRNWGKLDKKNDKPKGLPEKRFAANTGKSELNATILQALTAIDQSSAANPARAVPPPTEIGKPSEPAQTNVSSTAKTEATGTGLGPAQVLAVMWEHLEDMTNQYNNIVGPGPFHLNLQRESAGRSRASISTKTHCLILIPDPDAVRLYVLPIEMNRDEYNQGPQFEPNSIVLMTKRDGRIEWHTKMGVPLTAAVMNSTCRSLFQSLIEQTATFYA